MSTTGLVQLLRNDAGLLQMFVDTYIDTNGKCPSLPNDISKDKTIKTFNVWLNNQGPSCKYSSR